MFSGNRIDNIMLIHTKDRVAAHLSVCPFPPLGPEQIKFFCCCRLQKVSILPRSYENSFMFAAMISYA